MYSTCLHCHSDLGKNEVVERFPIGKKLAFDPARGRLWVVCSRCRRWNLTPLEERWEAIEECDRLYARTRMRVSTDNIGLVRAPAGLDVIRIGRPQRPEIAAWRYAGDFRRRWLARGVPISMLTVAPGLWGLAFRGVLPSGTWAMLGTGVALGAAILGGVWALGRPRRARIVHGDGRVETIAGKKLDNVRLVTDGTGWRVRLATDEELTGTSAVHTLRAVSTGRNFAGAPPRTIDAAVGLISDVGDAARFIDRLARASERTGIRDNPPEVALALEMALHDETERRAMDGELSSLETEWLLAEEIASIADDMFIPPEVVADLDRLRSGERAGAPVLQVTT